MATVVVALGGNAILQPGQRGTYEEQLENVKEGCKAIMALVEAGHRVAVTHGNGPQVGNVLLQQEAASGQVPAMPLFVCGAMTQGQLGFMMQMVLGNLLAQAGRKMPVVTLITQTEVDPSDPAFQNPAKPVGPFYTEQRARQLMTEKDYVMKEDSDRGWRRVVPSPEPQRVVESDIAARLLEAGTLVIASGGGGIPVVRTAEGQLQGIDAVLDKDRSARQFADDLNADQLMILTDVPFVAINFHQPNEEMLKLVTVPKMEEYQKEGHFRAGSMGPKVEAALRFVKAGGGRRKAVIGSLARVSDILKGESGTWIVP